MIDPARLPGPWRRFAATGWYLPFAVVLFALSLLPELRGYGTRLGDVPTHSFDAPAVVVVAVQCLPLAVCRRWPFAALGLVSLGFAADQLRGYHSPAGTALPLALIVAGYALGRHRRAAVALFTAAYAVLALALSRLGSGESPDEYVTFYLALALAWGIGVWLRATRAAEAERRRRVAQDTRTAERARIARELHDVVTHHVTAMVVQAEAARYLTVSPDRLDHALTAVSDTGRLAITDLRHLLDLLAPGHTGEDREPAAGRLLTLVEQTRRAGQPVEFTEEGTPAESTGSAGLVAYRVVQEALTNALKYAHGSRTSVQVRHGDREISVEVGTDAPASQDVSASQDAPRAVSPTGGSGRGLAGLRERVDVLGGEFSAGARAGGGFVVRARIPAGSGS
ncbi:sensor histidine kinase [Streptomyces sp. NRRL F-5126]|uniref:sensor histidine kinase n=1 Tax=Streptomyces sp. NRRL F-5126 TaxID=1463857 RepID=UPI0004C49C50|nr:histidine kinase [Streptomyces sp. NRRL F-5126]